MVNELPLVPIPNENKEADDTRGLGVRGAPPEMDEKKMPPFEGEGVGITCMGIGIRKPRVAKGSSFSSAGVRLLPRSRGREGLCLSEKDDWRARGDVMTDPNVGAGLTGRATVPPPRMPAVHEDQP